MVVQTCGQLEQRGARDVPGVEHRAAIQQAVSLLVHECFPGRPERHGEGRHLRLFLVGPMLVPPKLHSIGMSGVLQQWQATVAGAPMALSYLSSCSASLPADHSMISMGEMKQRWRRSCNVRAHPG